MARKHEVIFPKLEYEMVVRGISQKALGKLLRVSQPTIGRKLAGKCDWKIGDIETICNYLNKDYYELFK
mgnify:CR=1 FL=1